MNAHSTPVLGPDSTPNFAALAGLRDEAARELTGNILPFWGGVAVDLEYGGFRGLIRNDLSCDPQAPKGVIQNSRILWTFSQAHRLLGAPGYRTLADRAYEALVRHFWDRDFGGLFWMVEHTGQPRDTKKVTYAQAFGIYGFAEHFRATGHAASLEYAIVLYRLLEEHCRDPHHEGYTEGTPRDWTFDPAMILDVVQAPKSMNTHLHVLEAYTNLLRAWDDAGLRTRLRTLIRLLLDQIVDCATGHFKLHFDMAWNQVDDHISCGHDIEGSWLLVEAAEVLGDAVLLAEVRAVAVQMAQAVWEEGIDGDGGLFNETVPHGVVDDNKDWWPQAEAVVGFLNAYELTGGPHFLDAALASWRFIQQHIVDHENGEWFWGVTRTGEPLTHRAKSGPWKAPYHNGRACMEIVQRVDRLLPAAVVPGENGLPKIIVAAGDGARAEIYLHGAHVTSWQPAGGDERLFLSRTSEFRPGTAIRGGVPVIFPQFAGLGPLPKHGFARSLPWTLEALARDGNTATARLALRADEATRRIWPHDFLAEFTVTVGGPALTVALAVVNTGDQPFSFTAALHTYLRVAEISQVAVTGLAGLRYRDSVTGREAVQHDPDVRFAGEVDRIYCGVPGLVAVHEPGRATTVVAAGFPDVVVWNPGPDKGAALADLEPAGYRRMVCIEAAVIEIPVHLAPGTRWEGRQTVR
jgi:mannobiose 2-epimerase